MFMSMLCLSGHDVCEEIMTSKLNIRQFVACRCEHYDHEDNMFMVHYAYEDVMFSRTL